MKGTYCSTDYQPSLSGETTKVLSFAVTMFFHVREETRAKARPTRSAVLSLPLVVAPAKPRQGLQTGMLNFFTATKQRRKKMGDDDLLSAEFYSSWRGWRENAEHRKTFTCLATGCTVVIEPLSRHPTTHDLPPGADVSAGCLSLISHANSNPKIRQKINLLRAPFFPFSVFSALSLSINYLSASTQAVMGLWKLLCLLTWFLPLSFVWPSPVQVPPLQVIGMNNTLPGFTPLTE